MDNYQIIVKPSDFKEFINWLPQLEQGEKYYYCLFARNKYCKGLTHIKSDKQQLKRGTTDKERMFEKYWQLEAPFGAYTQKENPIPQEALALYMTLNPRSERIAAGELNMKLTKLFVNGDVRVNPYQEALSELQRSTSRKIFTIFDIDSKEMDPIRTDIMIRQIVGVKASFRVLETRGGYHILLRPATIGKEYQASWFNQMLKVPNLDIARRKDGKYETDIMIPVPGCIQGGFTPILHKSYT